jgi:hypothetical protein
MFESMIAKLGFTIISLFLFFFPFARAQKKLREETPI